MRKLILIEFIERGLRMEVNDVLQILSQGEDSRNQFIENVHNSDALAAEMVAFSNTLGGKLFVGVKDDGTIIGLSTADISRLNQLISNASSENIKPAINPLSTVMTINSKKLLIIDIPKGLNKPYQDKNGVFWVKSGADKRKATSREEMQRLFQSSGLIHADTSIARGMTIEHLDKDYFSEFFKRRYNEELKDQTVPLQQTISNMNLGSDGYLNLTGALLFGISPSDFLPEFTVKAVSYMGDSIATELYIDSRDIRGKLERIYRESLHFLMSNIKMLQKEQSVNSVGIPEIPKIVFEELIANALIHRDYYISAPIRILVFSDRIEIISPGHLPNNLTIENVKRGNSNVRNPVLSSFAYHIIPYRGVGSGIIRALENYEDIEFIDDREGNMFKCIIKRKKHF